MFLQVPSIDSMWVYRGSIFFSLVLILAYLGIKEDHFLQTTEFFSSLILRTNWCTTICITCPILCKIDCIKFVCIKFVLVLVQIDLIQFDSVLCVVCCGLGVYERNIET